MLINARTVRSTAYTSVGVVTVKADVVTKRKKVDHSASRHVFNGYNVEFQGARPARRNEDY